MGGPHLCSPGYCWARSIIRLSSSSRLGSPRPQPYDDILKVPSTSDRIYSWSNASRGARRGGKVLPPCSGPPRNLRLSLRVLCRKTTNLWAWPLCQSGAPAAPGGAGRAGHAQHPSDKPSCWGQQYGRGKQVSGECFGLFYGERQLNWPLDDREVSSERLWRNPPALPQSRNIFFGTSCPTVSLISPAEAGCIWSRIWFFY